MISQAKIDEALKLQDRLGKRMGQIIIDKGWVAENDVLRALSEQLGVPFVRVRPGLFDPAIAALLDRSVARRLCVLPLFRVRSVIYLASTKATGYAASRRGSGASAMRHSSGIGTQRRRTEIIERVIVNRRDGLST